MRTFSIPRGSRPRRYAVRHVIPLPAEKVPLPDVDRVSAR
jgi:hypothetical protein